MPAKYWNKTTIRYNQQKRTIEKFLTDLRTTKQVNFSLESCNVCAACCAIEAVGAEWKTKLPTLDNNNILSYADLMFNYIYSFPCGLPIVDRGNGICENECIENLAFAIGKMSTASAKVYYNNDTNIIASNIKDELLLNNSAIVTSYNDEYTPGHYICIVYYNQDLNMFIYYDSWNNSKRNLNGGILEKFKYDDLIKCIKHRYMTVKL